MYRIPDQRGVIVPTVMVCLLITFFGAYSLKIEKLLVPSIVELTSNDTPITLDCEYTYEPKEKLGVVVKWYHASSLGNKTFKQVYQWIVRHPPQSLGILKDRLDTEYEANSDEFSKHRALRIVKPTLHLSGEYKCHVSSNFHDDEKSHQMLIYSPARDITIEASNPSVHKMNITCKADGMFPTPVGELSVTKGSKKTRTIVSDALQSISKNDDGLYSIVIYKEFDKKHLSAETIFDCVVSVPETSYSAHRSYTYHLGQVIDIEGNGNSDPHEGSEPNRRQTNRTPESAISEPSYSGKAETITTPFFTLFVLVRSICLLLV